MRVIVIGAGIGGLTAALALRERGLDVEVFERSAELRDVGAGISLWPNALKALAQLGLGASLDAMSVVSREGALRTSDGHVLTRTTAHEMERAGGPPRVFHRAELLSVLVEAATRIPIHLGQTCTGVVHDAHRAVATFTDRAPATADAVVGADGLKSAVRAALGIPGMPRYAGYTAWRGLARFPHAQLLPGETLGCGRRFGMVPLSGERVYWYATSNQPEGEQQADGEAKRALLRVFAGWHEPVERLIETTDLILRNDIYDRDPVNRWGSGRVTLLGDAAHPMTPNLGQGACQAIEDALVLPRHLAEAPSVEHALRAYETERIARTTSVVLASRRIGRVFQIASPTFCRFRNLALRLAPPSLTVRSLAPIVGYEGHLERRSRSG